MLSAPLLMDFPVVSIAECCFFRYTTRLFTPEVVLRSEMINEKHRITFLRSYYFTAGEATFTSLGFCCYETSKACFDLISMTMRTVKGTFLAESVDQDHMYEVRPISDHSVRY